MPWRTQEHMSHQNNIHAHAHTQKHLAGTQALEHMCCWPCQHTAQSHICVPQWLWELHARNKGGVQVAVGIGRDGKNKARREYSAPDLAFPCPGKQKRGISVWRCCACVCVPLSVSLSMVGIFVCVWVSARTSSPCRKGVVAIWRFARQCT